MKPLISLGLLVLVGVSAARPAAADRSNSEVEIINDSDWAIHQLYLSPVSEEDWGVDQLGEHVIEANGGSFTLNRIPCNDYDVRLVDEDGDVCVVGEVPLCGDSDSWTISNDDLLACQVLTEE